jgi:alpha/beta superfamily hydrolase
LSGMRPSSGMQSSVGEGPDAERTEVTVPGDVGALEGLLEYPEDRLPSGGIVVAHPHPLHGATMKQPLVHRVAKACRREGLVTLRFNFRGVGRSAGSYSGTEEYRDVRAATAFLRQELPGLPVSLAGYSFGSVMSALAVVEGEDVASLALVALAVRWEEFMPGFLSRLGDYGGPVLSVLAERDDIAPPEEVTAFLQSTGVQPHTVVVPDVDHFFVGSQDAVADAVAGFARAVSLGDV